MLNNGIRVGRNRCYYVSLNVLRVSSERIEEVMFIGRNANVGIEMGLGAVWCEKENHCLISETLSIFWLVVDLR